MFRVDNETAVLPIQAHVSILDRMFASALAHVAGGRRVRPEIYSFASAVFIGGRGSRGRSKGDRRVTAGYHRSSNRGTAWFPSVPVARAAGGQRCARWTERHTRLFRELCRESLRPGMDEAILSFYLFDFFE